MIRLGKASTLRVRVVDRAGKPVAGAYLRPVRGAGTARCSGSGLKPRLQGAPPDGQTDAAGRFTWTSAPSDAVLFDIYKDGYMRRELYP